MLIRSILFIAILFSCTQAWSQARPPVPVVVANPVLNLLVIPVNVAQLSLGQLPVEIKVTVPVISIPISTATTPSAISPPIIPNLAIGPSTISSPAIPEPVAVPSTVPPPAIPNPVAVPSAVPPPTIPNPIASPSTVPPPTIPNPVAVSSAVPPPAIPKPAARLENPPYIPVPRPVVVIERTSPPQIPDLSSLAKKSTAADKNPPALDAAVDNAEQAVSPEVREGMLTYCETDEAKQIAALTKAGIIYKKDRQSRTLPAGLMLGSFVYSPTNPLPANYLNVVLTSNSFDPTTYEQQPTAKFLVIADDPDRLVTYRWLKALAREQCVAVVLGVPQSYYYDDPATLTEEVLELRAYVRNITDAPLLLAVNRNINRGINDKWMTAFADKGLDKWNGFALRGIRSFNGIYALSREQVCKQQGIPLDKPLLLYEWVDWDTNSRGAIISKQNWQNNAARFTAKLNKDGWRGLLLDIYDTNSATSRLDILNGSLKGVK